MTTSVRLSKFGASAEPRPRIQTYPHPELDYIGLPAHLPICSSLDDDPNYGTISGTSMAAPHISGIVAQVVQASPALTPAEIEDLLEDNAFKFTAGAAYEADPANADNTTSFDKGHGLVDVKAAVAELRGVTIPSETPLPTVNFSCVDRKSVV